MNYQVFVLAATSMLTFSESTPKDRIAVNYQQNVLAATSMLTFSESTPKDRIAVNYQVFVLAASARQTKTAQRKILKNTEKASFLLN